MKAQPAILAPALPRDRQRNYISAINRKWANWTLAQFGGGVAPVVAGETITFAIGGAPGYSLAILDLTAILAIGTNRPWALSFEVLSISGGARTRNTLSLNGIYTLVGGSVTVAPVGVTGRYGCQFLLSAVTSPTLWVGIGADGVNDTANTTVVIRRPVLEYLSPQTAGPYFEGLNAQSELFRSYVPKNTLSGDSTGLVTFDRSQAVPSVRSLGIIIGDSFSTSQFVSGGWPAEFTNRYPQFAWFNMGTAGVTLQTNAANIASILALPETDISGALLPSFAVIQGGINDVVASATYGSHAVAFAMMASFKTMANAVKAAGIKSIIGMGIGPASGSVSYVAANGHQSLIVSYNAWLEAYCRSQGYGFVDTYRILASEVNDISIDTVYTSGDALHPNQYGSAMLAKEVYHEFCELS